ncbi:MAG: N-acetyltransferase [Candidatus Solibacter usitatus]|nr:N-acetyltransferase [Candidatus Solibacter usitatus]
MEVEIVPVQESRALRQFIEFPYQLYRRDPYWVPPLRLAQKDLLDTAKHPFYRHAEIQCFLARRQGAVAGRIAAILDRDQFSPDHLGFFGFFECEDSPPAAAALLEAARKWLRDRDVRVIRGPVSPSTNYESGLLVDGFDSSPYVMMTYNPRYYPALLEGAGLGKAKDLHAYGGPVKAVDGDKAGRVAARALRRGGMTIRTLRMKQFDAEVENVWRVYNAAWSRNWGFVPMSKEEFQFQARDMKQILDPGFALIGEVEGRAVGFALALPDINRALRHAGGDLFPLGLLKILYYQRRIKAVRVIALGVIEEYRTAGVAAGFYANLIGHARRLGYQECEFSWVLEDNLMMNRSIEALGARRTKTYRIYEWK